MGTDFGAGIFKMGYDPMLLDRGIFSIKEIDFPHPLSSIRYNLPPITPTLSSIRLIGSDLDGWSYFVSKCVFSYVSVYSFGICLVSNMVFPFPLLHTMDTP